MARINSPWWHAKNIQIHMNNGDSWSIDGSYEGNGLQFQASEVCRCLRLREVESKVMPHEVTLDVMGVLDGVWDVMGGDCSGEVS